MGFVILVRRHLYFEPRPRVLGYPIRCKEILCTWSVKFKPSETQALNPIYRKVSHSHDQWREWHFLIHQQRVSWAIQHTYFLHGLKYTMKLNIFLEKSAYHQTSNKRGTLLGNKIVDHSDVIGALPACAHTHWKMFYHVLMDKTNSLVKEFE